MLINQYKYKTPDLVKVLGVSRQTLVSWEKIGKFSPPRNMRGERVFTEDQLKEILTSFSPGGKGEWKFITT
jgi:predicted site-specific integrase-resolvase